MSEAADESLNRVEEEVRRFWQLHRIPEAVRARAQDGAPYLINHQPLRAAGQSRVDQIRLLSTIDLLARYQAMRGRAVRRLLGWACHGLALELAVERTLATEAIRPGIGRFHSACRQAVEEGIQEEQTLALRLGVWAAVEETYRTMDPQPIGRVWKALRRLWEDGRLRLETRVAPTCTRCGTPLSEAEAGQKVLEVDGCQTWVRLPWDGEPESYLLIHVPEPWMLLGLVAVAAHPESSYVLVDWFAPSPAAGVSRRGGRDKGKAPSQGDSAPVRLLLGERALRRGLEGDYRVVRSVSPKSLQGTRYRPLFTFPLRGLDVVASERLHRIVLSPEVPLDEGTGLQAVTPSFDASSLALTATHGLPVPHILDEWGHLDDAITPWRGLNPLDTEILLVHDLEARGLLFRVLAEARSQSLCPYCQGALLPLAQPVWSIDGGVTTWLVGRNRAWGTPLPVWRCEACGEQAFIPGLDDLASRAGVEADQIDLHRPSIDRLTFECQRCCKQMKRVAPIIDSAWEEAVLAWSMPSQPGPANVAIGVNNGHPGWLEDMAQTTASLGGPAPWQRALSIPGAELGPAWSADHSLVADALRWATYTQGTPNEAERQFLRPVWVCAAEWGKALGEGERVGRQLGAGEVLLEQWVYARLHEAIRRISRALDACNPAEAAQELGSLVGDLGGWYLPYRSDGSLPVLQVLARLLAPFVPHVAEAIYRRNEGTRAVAGMGEVESVHLTEWPVARSEWADRPLLERMRVVQGLAALGQAARDRAELDAAKCLERAQVAQLPGNGHALEELSLFADLLTRAVNVEKLELSQQAMGRVKWQLRLDRETTASRSIPFEEIEAALGQLDPSRALDLAMELWQGLSVSVESAGRAVTLLPAEIKVVPEADPGWTAAAGGGYLIVLRVD